MVSKANLEIYQGDDFAADVTVLLADGVTPADLTGYTAQSQIRFNSGDTSANGVAQFTCTISANVVTILLAHDVTRTLTRGSYTWDLQVIDSAIDWITTILAGSVSVTKEVTTYEPLAAAR